MISPAPIPPPLDWEIRQGFVESQHADRFYLHVAGSSITASCAASCLLQPQPGDCVLLAYGEQNWILTVLTRAAAHTPAHIQIDSAAVVHTKGSLTLSTEQDLYLTSFGEQQLTSRHFTLDSSSATVRCEQSTLCAKTVHLIAHSLNQVVEQIEQVAKRLLQRITHRFCTVVAHDEQRCGSKRMLVKESVQIQAESIIQRAQEHMTLDGKHIHMG